MRLTTLFLIAAFAASTVGAASYQKIDGTVVDPILAIQDGALVYSDYSGPNLEPDANLKNVILTHAFLWDADLTNANLSDADLDYADLFLADLSYANLSNANLTNVNLSYADLYGANLSHADLLLADLSDADLHTADLSDADLRYANLTDANLSNAKLTNANLYQADWEFSNWTDAYYYTDNIPTWGYGMDQAWHDWWGILAIDPMSGDLNGNGVLDAADYTMWQDSGGDQIDYRTWKDHFGQSIASGSGANHVPEPTTLLLSLLALVAVPLRVRHG